MGILEGIKISIIVFDSFYTPLRKIIKQLFL